MGKSIKSSEITIMFKDKGILKYKSENSKGPMHYIKVDGDVYTLTLSSSQKVKDIKNNPSMKIAPNLLSRKFVDKTIEVIDDLDKVRMLFDTMLDKKNTHFKNWNDQLTAIRVS